MVRGTAAEDDEEDEDEEEDMPSPVLERFRALPFFDLDLKAPSRGRGLLLCRVLSLSFLPSLPLLLLRVASVEPLTCLASFFDTAAATAATADTGR